MDASEVRRIVEANLATYLKAFGIAHWEIQVGYNLRKDGDGSSRTAGYVEKLVDYDKAFIQFDPDCCSSEDDVLRHLRHELFHVVLSPYGLFGELAEELARGNAKAREMAMRIWHHCDERGVMNLERMYAGLCELQVKREPKGKAK